MVSIINSYICNRTVTYLMRRDVFQAIADPTRREIIRVIALKSMNLNAVSEHFDISRPAISKHIKILTECGLISIRTEGRERICEAKLSNLHQVAEWVEEYKTFWSDKLDALGHFLESESSPKLKSKTSLKRKPKY